MNFYSIGEIPAAGFSSTIKNYSVQDKTPVNGINYYRVKMIESDAKYQHSAIVKTTNIIERSWYVISNPGSENIQVIGTEKADKIDMIDPLGTVIFSSRSNGNNCTISTSHLPNGVYFIRSINNNGSKTIPINISH